MTVKTKDSQMSDADICRRNGWTVGTNLEGDEGYGPTVIQITAIGERRIIAKVIRDRGIDVFDPSEGNWTLWCREWKEVKTS